MKNKILKVVFTGAESTGKSTLAKLFASKYNTIWLPEYARTYVENLQRPYTYDDVVKITQKQLKLEEEFQKKSNKILFADTSFIILRVWFDVVYKKRPEWFDKKLIENIADLYLLCNNDISWEPDNVRENDNKKRGLLFDMYRQELINLKAEYAIVTGTGSERIENANNIIRKKIKNSLIL